MSASGYSRCPALRMEANYARTQIHIERGEEDLALEPALASAREGFRRWGPVPNYREIITGVARSAASRGVRHRDPAALVAFFEAHLEDYTHLLDGLTRFQVGWAYDAIGTPARASEELLFLLIDEPELEFRDALLLKLGETLLAADDSYRAGLVLRHLEARPPAKELFRLHRLAGRHALARGRTKDGIKEIIRARSLLPPGDRKAELALDLSRARLEEGDIPASAKLLEEATRAQTLSGTTLLPAAISVLSSCARACSRGQLQAAVDAVQRRIGLDNISPRLRAALARRGVIEAASKNRESASELWTRLDALGLGNVSAKLPERELP